MCATAPAASEGDCPVVPLDTRPFRGRGGGGKRDVLKVVSNGSVRYPTTVQVDRGKNGAPRLCYAMCYLCNCTPVYVCEMMCGLVDNNTACVCMRVCNNGVCVHTCMCTHV